MDEDWHAIGKVIFKGSEGEVWEIELPECRIAHSSSVWADNFWIMSHSQ